MPSPTSRLRLLKQAPGSNFDSWGAQLNAGALDLADEAWGVAGITVAANVVLPATNYLSDVARRLVLVLTGAGGFTVTTPAVDKPYFIINQCAANVTVTPAGGSGAVVRAGTAVWWYCDGTNGFVADMTLDRVRAPAANVPLGGFRLTGVGNPVNLQDASTKAYVDAAIISGSIGFTPVEQGGGASQLTNKIYIGHDGTSPRIQVDSTDFGRIALESRAVNTGTGLTGGGDLSADRTIAIAAGGVGTTQLADSGVTTPKISNTAVTNAKLANMAEGSIKGRTRFTGTGEPEDLGFSQVLAIVNAALASSLGTSGYTTLVSGLIIQWGFNAKPETSNSNGDTAHAITFPITFPNQTYTVVATAFSGDVPGAGAVVRDVTTSGCAVNLRGNASTPYAINYIAFGV
jgi:hypothetical protein